MEINRAKQLIVEVLQIALTGQLDSSSNVNPMFIADAIASKVNFEKTNNSSKCDEIIGTLIDFIVTRRIEMEEERSKLRVDEILLRNFIRGKLTAYEEILQVLNTL